MCGITGIFAFNEIGRFNLPNLSLATEALAHRGPDHQNIFVDEFVGLGHRRLSIIDLSNDANQPMSADGGRYQLVFNGEIYNYKALRKELIDGGLSFSTESDTEVLLKLLIHEGQAAINKLNGFFAFAFYDASKAELVVARDRYGIKPLYYYQDEDKFIFASELKSILKYGVNKTIDYNSLYTYLQLNYLPAPLSMISGVKKLMPGEMAVVHKKSVQLASYYSLSATFDATFKGTYQEAQLQLKERLTNSVQGRLVADVPLGSFLSGGVDSSIIASIAQKSHPDLHTYSVGYSDNRFFDETEYAEAVAKHIGAKHKVFKLSQSDLYGYLPQMLKQFSEPFADSSALPVYALSQLTRQEVTVALSGDGADELFAGYNKHAAMYRMWHPGLKEKLVNAFGGIWKSLPQSRNSSLGNLSRQLHKFASAAGLDVQEQYWLLASLSDTRKATDMLADAPLEQIDFETFDIWKEGALSKMRSKNINDALLTDQQLVLQGDMLPKVDLMSMAHALEVRVPFLDHEVVAFANSLPEAFKLNSKMKKRILQDTFRAELPSKIYNRPKHGFEVPLLSWMQGQLKSDIENKWLAPDYIREQGIFDEEGVARLKKNLFSRNPGDSHAHVWGLICFQEWYEQYIA
jgi:asparagine synthase (glutamine-hydrolysing)